MGGLRPDFVLQFPHIDCVSKLCPSTFKTKYQSWYKANHYNYSEAKAAQIHAYPRTQVNSLPMAESVIKIVESSVKLLNSTLETLAVIRVEMDKLSSTLPEYETVMSLYGVGRVMCSQLIAEIGDVRRKRSEGKPYRVYMIAAARKFLGIYYARVMEAIS